MAPGWAKADDGSGERPADRVEHVAEGSAGRVEWTGHGVERVDGDGGVGPHCLAVGPSSAQPAPHRHDGQADFSCHTTEAEATSGCHQIRTVSTVSGLLVGTTTWVRPHQRAPGEVCAHRCGRPRRQQPCPGATPWSQRTSTPHIGQDRAPAASPRQRRRDGSWVNSIEEHPISVSAGDDDGEGELVLQRARPEDLTPAPTSLALTSVATGWGRAVLSQDVARSLPLLKRRGVQQRLGTVTMEPMLIVGYVRVSTKGQADDRLGLEVQVGITGSLFSPRRAPAR